MKTKNTKLPARWQMTEISWFNVGFGYGWQTNIPDDTSQGVHEIANVTAISRPDRIAVITFDMFQLPCRGPEAHTATLQHLPCFGPKARRIEILQRLQEISPNAEVSCDSGSQFKICLRLKKSFCDEVIGFIKTLFEKMGITDSVIYHLQNFHITTQTYVRRNELYVQFSDYLKHRHDIVYDKLEWKGIPMPSTDPLT